MAGYSFVDAHTAGGSQITDNELPAGQLERARSSTSRISAGRCSTAR